VLRSRGQHKSCPRSPTGCLRGRSPASRSVRATALSRAPARPDSAETSPARFAVREGGVLTRSSASGGGAAHADSQHSRVLETSQDRQALKVDALTSLYAVRLGGALRRLLGRVRRTLVLPMRSAKGARAVRGGRIRSSRLYLPLHWVRGLAGRLRGCQEVRCGRVSSCRHSRCPAACCCVGAAGGGGGGGGGGGRRRAAEAEAAAAAAAAGGGGGGGGGRRKV
jgi:hypothetical protein